MMILNKNRKGELTTKQLVTIIVIIVSFIIILFLIFRLNLGETTDKQICYNSVLLKGQSKIISGPLDCRTNYLCISGGENCEGTQTSKVEVDPKNKTQIMEALAKEMSDCWWMFGEGKIDYVSAGKFKQVACSICSIVRFDEGVQERIPGISYREFYDYLRETPQSSSQTYLKYLYLANSIEDFEEQSKVESYLENQLEFGKTYFILTGRTKQGYLSRFGLNLFHAIPIIGGDTNSTPYPVVIMERTKENYDAIGCDVFLTKA